VTKIRVASQIRIPKKQLTRNQRKQLEFACTVRNNEYDNAILFDGWVRADIPQFYTAFEYNSKYICIPRGVLDKTVDILGDVEVEYQTANFRPIGLEFIKQMQDRPEQNEAVNDLLDHDTGILVSPTGSGKTNIMIKVIQHLDQPTLILLHRDHLIQQWKSRIEEYLGYTPGIIGEGKWKVKNITIAMFPTLHANEQRMPELTKRFGLVIIDECHHIPAYTWLSKVIQLGPHYIYGCSATPKRKDGLQKLMFICVGPIRHILQDRNAVKAGSIMPIHVKVMRTQYTGWIIRRKTEFNALARDLCLDSARNKLIVDTIIANKNRTQLILSDRIEHIKMLLEKLQATGQVQVEMIIGETNPKRRAEIFEQVKNGETNVLLASSIADEGLDLPILDTLHLTFPTANPDRNMQQMGRIRRPYPNKKDAIVFDYFDWQNPTFNRQFQNRRRKYRSNGFQVDYIGDLH
jgi:superfamily II DNA or RNA helicase